MTTPTRIVLDSNVLVAAARSKKGASYALVSSIPNADFIPCLSVSLYSEWQDVLTRPENLSPNAGPSDVQEFLRYLASHSYLKEVHFLWRPYLPDADDDMVLELAFAAGGIIITHNVNDFRGADRLGVQVLTPADFLKSIRKRS